MEISLFQARECVCVMSVAGCKILFPQCRSFGQPDFFLIAKDAASSDDPGHIEWPDVSSSPRSSGKEPDSQPANQPTNQPANQPTSQRGSVVLQKPIIDLEDTGALVPGKISDDLSNLWGILLLPFQVSADGLKPGASGVVDRSAVSCMFFRTFPPTFLEL